MKIKELVNWPPVWTGKDSPSEDALLRARLRAPKKLPGRIAWTATVDGRKGEVEFATKNQSRLDRLWPIFVEMDGQTAQVIGERDVPERDAAVPAAAPQKPGVAMGPRTPPPAPVRTSSRYVPYGHLDSQGHGDGNVG
jgi:hypothetical protein